VEKIWLLLLIHVVGLMRGENKEQNSNVNKKKGRPNDCGRRRGAFCFG
jgi:hypothetical protein